MKRLLVLVCFLVAGQLWATTYYVSASGSDSNAGTSTGAPWQTITKANAAFVAATITSGDTLAFNGVDTFSGNLIYAPASPLANEAARITITSYGSGRAIINPGNGHGIHITDTGFVTINNINVTGPGFTTGGTWPTATASTTSTGTGIYWETTALNTYRTSCYTTNVTVDGCFNGIEYINTSGGGNSILKCWDDAQILDSVTKNIGIIGIVIWGDTNHSSMPNIVNRNPIVRRCTAFNVFGIQTYSVGAGNSGYGIYPFNCSGLIMEDCLAYNIGVSCAYSSIAGPTGIGILFTSGSRIRRCESYLVYTTGSSLRDGNPLGIDTVNTDWIVENCYWHSSGSGVGQGELCSIYDAGGTSGGVIRYCVFANGAGTSTNNGGSMIGSNSGGDVLINNCTFYDSTGAQVFFSLGGATVSLYNNILWSAGAQTYGTIGASSNVKGNTYHLSGGSTFSLTVGSTAYTTITALRTAGFEKQGGSNVGATGDPLFTTSGFASPFMPAPLRTMVAYDIATGSSAQAAGVSQATLGITVATSDWHGNAAASGVDSGAVAFGSTFTALPRYPSPPPRRF